jgi:hypothetical protein
LCAALSPISTSQKDTQMRLLVLISRLHLTTDGLCVRALCDSSENKYPLLRVRQGERKERERGPQTQTLLTENIYLYLSLGAFGLLFCCRVSD